MLSNHTIFKVLYKCRADLSSRIYILQSRVQLYKLLRNTQLSLFFWQCLFIICYCIIIAKTNRCVDIYHSKVSVFLFLEYTPGNASTRYKVLEVGFLHSHSCQNLILAQFKTLVPLRGTRFLNSAKIRFWHSCSFGNLYFRIHSRV